MDVGFLAPCHARVQALTHMQSVTHEPFLIPKAEVDLLQSAITSVLCLSASLAPCFLTSVLVWPDGAFIITLSSTRETKCSETMFKNTRKLI